MPENIPQLPPQIRDLILACPEVVLHDGSLMAALTAQSEAAGANVIDLRTTAIRQLEDRLRRLESTHKSVIAAAYDNMLGTSVIQRAILQLMGAQNFDAFLDVVLHDLPRTLRLEAVRLVLESHQAGTEEDGPWVGEAVIVVPAGQTQDWMSGQGTRPSRSVLLHQPRPALSLYYGEKAGQIGSEAVLLLDIGPRRLPGVLVLGAGDEARFAPHQGTELLEFFARFFERLMQRWLS